MSKIIDFNMNLLRNVAILMVVLLHVNAESMHLLFDGNVSTISTIIIQFYSVLTRIAVPLFILISGRYILSSARNTSLADFYLKRLPRLLIPILAWSFIYFFICSNKIPTTTITSYLKDFSNGFAHNNIAIHIWYLYMLFPLYLIAPFLYQVLNYFSFKHSTYIAILLCIFGTSVEAWKNITVINLWFLWWLEFMGLFAFGYILRDFKKRSNKISLLFIAIFLEIIATSGSLLLFWQGNEFVYIFHLGVVPHTQIAAILIYLYFNSIYIGNNCFVECAAYVLGIYLIHPIFIIFMQEPNYTGILFIDIFLKTIAVYLISLITIALLSNIKFLRKILQ